MEWERYDTVRCDTYTYEFYSEGPKGKIRKIVKLRHFKRMGINVYNLAFGDLNASTGHIDDTVTSNNNDQMKVLITVAEAVVDFMRFKPNAIILVKGSTISRTRLYQMRISSLWLEINQQYEIYGEFRNEWTPFQRGVNDEQFLIFKKIK